MGPAKDKHGGLETFIEVEQHVSRRMAVSGRKNRTNFDQLPQYHLTDQNRSNILSDIDFFILSDIDFFILSDIYSDILFGIFGGQDAKVEFVEKESRQVQRQISETNR